MAHTVLTLNNIAQSGLNEFDPEKYTITQSSNTPHAIIVRSQNMRNYSLPDSLEIVGRAGAGTNNIPVDECTKRGIPVMNTPGANANAVKELVLASMLLACRNILPAWNYVNTLDVSNDGLGPLVEKNKKRFTGSELPGRTLAVIGLGNIGIEIANSAVELGMKVIGFDPAITVRSAWKLSANVHHADSLAEALSQADFISLHVPLIEKTKNIINENTIRTMKTGVILLNFAREGIIDNAALLNAIEQKKIAYYACDFPNNLFKGRPNIICLPHLGASTKEAEENCAIMIARQVQSYIEDGQIIHSINFPDVKLPRSDGYRISITNRNVPNMVAQISTLLSEANINIIDMINKSKGDIAYNLMDLDKTISTDIIENLTAIDGVIRSRRLFSINNEPMHTSLGAAVTKHTASV